MINMENKIAFKGFEDQELTIEDLRRYEEDFGKLPEVGFKFNYKQKNENFAEDLLEDL